jgi:hypothetical protein
MRANWPRVVAALLLVAGLGCSSNSKDSCSDVSANICDTLDDCGNLSPTFGSHEECVASFNGLWEVENRADEECRTQWELIQDLTCDQLLDYFSL